MAFQGFLKKPTLLSFLLSSTRTHRICTAVFYCPIALFELREVWNRKLQCFLLPDIRPRRVLKALASEVEKRSRAQQALTSEAEKQRHAQQAQKIEAEKRRRADASRRKAKDKQRKIYQVLQKAQQTRTVPEFQFISSPSESPTPSPLIRLPKNIEKNIVLRHRWTSSRMYDPGNGYDAMASEFS
eukprot:IDg114t1